MTKPDELRAALEELASSWETQEEPTTVEEGAFNHALTGCARDLRVVLAAIPSPEIERYRAIIEDTARELEVDASIRMDGPRIAANLRHWLADPADFDKYAGMVGAIGALAKDAR